VTIGLVILVAGSICYFVFLDATRIPTNLVTPLQETLSRQNIYVLYGLQKTDPSFLMLKVLLASFGRASPCLKNIVKMNLWFAVVNFIFFFFIAYHLLKKAPLALLFSVVFAFNLCSIHSAVSESDPQFMTTIFFLGILAASVADHPHTRKSRRKDAHLLLVILTIVAGLAREEFALFGILALSVILWNRHADNPNLQQLQTYLYSLLRKFEEWPLRNKLLLIAGLIVPWVSIDLRPPWLWIVDGFHPLNPSIATFPFVLSFFLPAGVIVLFVIGMWHTLKLSRRFLLLPVAVIVLYRNIFFGRLRRRGLIRNPTLCCLLVAVGILPGNIRLAEIESFLKRKPKISEMAQYRYHGGRRTVFCLDAGGSLFLPSR